MAEYLDGRTDEEETPITKKQMILNHLQSIGHITSLQAIREYGDTRLSDTIFQLRREYNIVSIPQDGKDRWGHKVKFVTYKYNGKRKDLTNEPTV